MRRRPEMELIPFAASFLPGQRWLVLAPHADDETLGAGGTLTRAARAGVDVRVVVVTDGSVHGSAPVREREAGEALAVLGIGTPRFWRLPDARLDPGDPRLRSGLREELSGFAPDLVLGPSPVELHPDHRAVALALHAAVRRATLLGLRRRPPQWVAVYEIGSPLLPNALVDVGPTWEVKAEALARYESQLATRPYLRLAEAMAVYRTRTLDGVERAEAFHLTATRRLAHRSTAAWARDMGSARALP